MGRTRILAAGLAAGLALAAAGCGGSGGGGSKTTAVGSGAALVPASAPLFVTIDTDFSSARWKKAFALLDRLPGKEQLYALLRKQLFAGTVDFNKEVKPALGPEVDVAVLASPKDAVFGLTKAKDAGKLAALLAKGKKKLVHEEIGGWTAFAEAQATLDALKKAQGGAMLDGRKTYKDSIASLPEDALATTYANGPGAAEALKGTGVSGVRGLAGAAKVSRFSAALVAEDRSASVELDVAWSAPPPKPYRAQLLDLVPSGAIAVVSFADLDGVLGGAAGNPSLKKQLGPLGAGAGKELAALAALFEDEGVLYARTGLPLPEVTLVVKVNDEQGALATLDKALRQVTGLLGGGRPSVAVQLDGVPARRFDLGAVALYAAAFDGKLVVTDSRSAVGRLRGGGPRLVDDPRFEEAKKAAGLPDETTGFAYVDLETAGPLVESLSGVANVKIPAEVKDNLSALRTLVLYGSGGGPTTTVKLYVGIK